MPYLVGVLPKNNRDAHSFPISQNTQTNVHIWIVGIELIQKWSFLINWLTIYRNNNISLFDTSYSSR